jgi:FXSXX-COOH protein
MDAAEPDVEGYLLKVDDLPLDDVLQGNDTVLAHAVRQLIESALSTSNTVSAFNNYI